MNKLARGCDVGWKQSKVKIGYLADFVGNFVVIMVGKRDSIITHKDNVKRM